MAAAISGCTSSAIAGDTAFSGFTFTTAVGVGASGHTVANSTANAASTSTGFPKRLNIAVISRPNRSGGNTGCVLLPAAAAALQWPALLLRARPYEARPDRHLPALLVLLCRRNQNAVAVPRL